ncbi:TonB-dependent receptor [Flavobacterium sp. D11R37]|uniref:TonB-dependent receptor n=1 Tax=Flavobacterium coralii TaxID=2838017 RepID=UPI001CA6A009|nr:TonB-dependent receptor [Flavobacterium coralii]MBY8963820.1 TonB-dependent receptor [Flavobacterium coralii]
MTNFTRILFSVSMMLIGVFAMAQETITGTVTDGQMPLPGASITVTGTMDSATTDVNGMFTLQTSSLSGELTISYLGFNSLKLPFTINPGQQLNIGTINLTENSEELETVVIIGRGVIDLEQDRRTPVAVSNISQREIKLKSGNQEFPEVMKNTPSVYVASQAGGYGDSKMYVRGFDQTNTAFLLNGQPINGMEDGNMYWSNWSGMTDVANSVQVQRGLGSSKLAISSVGGTVNIVTKATDFRQGGFAQSIIGNDDYQKTTLSYNTGLMENGFGFSAMLTKWSGDGYNRGTFGEGYNYFISLGYKPNDQHLFNFLVFGAPQWHDQNFTKPIADYLKFGRKYNNNYGFLDGDYLSERRNYYHKPVLNLNWDWNINSAMELSSVLYASYGRGGGTGNWGNGRVRTADGHVDFNTIRDNNMMLPGMIGTESREAGERAYAIRNSVNNHAWYGLVSNFNHRVNDNFSYNAGLDVRTYKGTHYREISNLLGLNGFRVDNNVQYPDGYVVTETFSANPWSAFTNDPADNQKVNYDYDERISYGGIFGQAEYATDMFSVFIQGSVSTQSHIRWDRFGYTEAEEESDRVSNTGFNIKGGGSFNINEQNTIFVNAGYYSKQPYHDNIYLNFGNDVNPLTENEKITGIEAGYRFKSQYLDINLDAYRTSWKDRVTTESDIADQGEAVLYINNSGLSQLHTGIELSFMARPLEQLDVRGFASLGNWEYDDDVYIRVFDENQNLVSDGQFTINDEPVIGEQIQDVDGSKVGGGAQTTIGLGAIYRITPNFSIDTDWRTYDNLYAQAVVKENLELPSYDLVDAGVTYTMKFVKSSLTFRLNVNNVFDEVYISELTSAIPVEESAETYKGINVNNFGFFGNGRTWNFGMRFNF